MIKRSIKLNLAVAFAFVSLMGGADTAIAQSTAQDAATAAEEVAREAEAAANAAADPIRTIDPDTVSAPPAVDAALPEPDAGAMPKRFEPGLPPLEDDLPELPPVADEELGSVEPPRTPAIREISRPIVQALPTPQPTTRAPAATREIVSNDPFVIKSILPVGGTIKYGEHFWNESRAPKKGKLVITVDLNARVISVFRDGHEIGTAVALLGTKSHPTPLGRFKILTKEKDNVSEKYNNAPMPWTLRLTWSGIAIHGSPVINGYASHGCVGVPDEFAEKLFAIAKVGDEVVITRGGIIGVGDKIG